MERSRRRHVQCRQLLDFERHEVVLHRPRRRSVVLRRLAHAEPIRKYPIGARQRPSGVLVFLMVCHALRSRHGNRARLLVDRRTHLSLRLQPLHGRGDGRNSRGGSSRHAPHFLPLGTASMGTLCLRRTDALLLRLQKGTAADDTIVALSPDRKPNLRTDRTRRRHHGDHRNSLRNRYLARLGSQTDRYRAQRTDRNRILCNDQRAYRSDRGHLVDSDHLGRFRRGQGNSNPIRVQPVALHCDPGLLPALRSHALSAQLLLAEPWRLHRARTPAQLLVGSQQRRKLARWMDSILLGMVDLMGTLRRHVHRAY